MITEWAQLIGLQGGAGSLARSLGYPAGSFERAAATAATAAEEAAEMLVS